MKAGKVKEVFGSTAAERPFGLALRTGQAKKAKEKRFKLEDRRCHRSEYRKPLKEAQLVKPVSKKTAEKNMKALLRRYSGQE
jgi:ribosomal protein S4